MSRGSRPGERRGGRQRGTPNRLTRDLKSMIEGALHTVGGQRYLVTIAREQPDTFCRLLAKILPRDLNVTLPPEANAAPSLLQAARRLAFLFTAADKEAKKEATEIKARRLPIKRDRE